MLYVSLLGGFNISQDDTPVRDVDSPRLQSLLAYLILYRDAPQSRAYLAYQFWPDTSENQARTNLRNLLHSLRHALPWIDSYLDVGIQTLQWRSDHPYTVDVLSYESALNDAKLAEIKRNFSVKREALAQVVSLYRGDLLPSCYDDWIIPRREELRQRYLDSLEELVHLLEERRDYDGAIRYAQQLLQNDSIHEPTYRNLIRLHALNGDRAAGLRVYHSCATTLRRELDVEPSAATRKEYEQLFGKEVQPNPALPIISAFSPLVSREDEWITLLHTWKNVISNSEPHVVMISGVAGIGKTRLMEEQVQWADRQGITRAGARCYAAEGSLTFAPITTWLRSHPLVDLDDIWLCEVARLLPELINQRPDLPKPAALTAAWQRQHLFEGLSRAILSIGQPLLLTMDDLQWCDRDTLEWLHYLLRYDRTSQFMVIGTYRPEEVGEEHPLEALLKACRQEANITEVELQPLDKASTQTLANFVAGMDLDSITTQRLYQDTEGNPLFVVETVRASLQAHVQQPDSDNEAKIPKIALSGDTSLPTRVQSVLYARLAQLSAPARELAGMAAVIGREFSFELLARTSGSDEDTLVRELDELWHRRIIREHGVNGYDFSHDKLREVAYNNLSGARRRLLHHHIAQVLEIHDEVNLDPVSHQLAIHYERAGSPEQAVPYYLRAARVARQVYANEESISLLKHSLELVQNYTLSKQNKESSNELMTSLWEELGDILELRAQHAEALDAYQNAQSKVNSKDCVWRARLYRKNGIVLQQQRLYPGSLAACNQAELALGESPDINDTVWWKEWMEVQVERVWGHYWLAQWPEMEQLVNKVQPVAKAIGGSASRARFLMAASLMHLRREHYVVSDEMLNDQYEAVAASQESGDIKIKIECQFELGFLHVWRRELDEAEKNLLAALEMIEISGMIPMKVLNLTYLTVLSRFKGDIEGVKKYSLYALKAAEAAHMPDYIAAAMGNQAWIFWREGDFVSINQSGEEALNLWQQSPLVYPFQWLALWPLLGVAIEQGREENAWEYIHKMLDPQQQLLPDRLNTALEAAVQARTKGEAEAASKHLGDAIKLAFEMGYL